MHNDIEQQIVFGRDIQSSCLEGHYEEIGSTLIMKQKVNITPKGDHVTIW